MHKETHLSSHEPCVYVSITISRFNSDKKLNGLKNTCSVKSQKAFERYTPCECLQGQVHMLLGYEYTDTMYTFTERQSW